MVALSQTTIRQALHLPSFDGLAAQRKMMPVPRPVRRPPNRPGEPNQGAVLLLLYCKKGDVYLVLTRRRDDLQSHAGQVSLPGGRREHRETLQEAALRETYEEVGVPPSRITILGRLTPLYIAPSDFEVHPFVGWHEPAPVFVPQDSEVAELLEVPVALFLRDESRDQELWEWRDILLEVPFYRIDEHKVWGATAMMLSEFAERLRLQNGEFTGT